MSKDFIMSSRTELFFNSREKIFDNSGPPNFKAVLKDPEVKQAQNILNMKIEQNTFALSDISPHNLLEEHQVEDS